MTNTEWLNAQPPERRRTIAIREPDQPNGIVTVILTETDLDLKNPITATGKSLDADRAFDSAESCFRVRSEKAPCP